MQKTTMLLPFLHRHESVRFKDTDLAEITTFPYITICPQVKDFPFLAAEGFFDKLELTFRKHYLTHQQTFLSKDFDYKG